MGQKLTNQQKAKIFTMYWGCNCVPKNIQDIQYKIWSVPYAEEYVLTKESWNMNSFDKWKLDDLNIILASLKDITDEHAIEVARLTNSIHPDEKCTVYRNGFNKPVVSWGQAHFQKYMIETETVLVGTYYTYEQGELLRELGYMLPYKGQDLFKLGIAVNKNQK